MQNMLAKNLPILVFLSLAIPNIGMSGVMIDEFESKTSFLASTGGDETPLREEQESYANSANMNGIISSSRLMKPINLQVIGVETELLLQATVPLKSGYGFGEWKFVPDGPILKIQKIPIDSFSQRI